MKENGSSRMSERRNYYRLLNAQPDAPIEVIRNNYRTLLQKLRLHPDLGGADHEASSINEAYQVLSDPERRARYDQQLLQQHGIKTLSQGNLKKHPGQSSHNNNSSERDGHGNQRNYYRVLNVQPDAPDSIIRTSYLSQKKQHSDKLPLFNEAYSVLGNPDKRAMYDRLLMECDHATAVEKLRLSSTNKIVPTQEPSRTEKIKPMQANINQAYGNNNAQHYRPVITQYCAFCKTPHSQSPCEDTAPLCMECNSPLFPPSNAFLEQNRRDIVRLAQRNGECKAYLNWPGNALQVNIGDLSPVGMQILTPVGLTENQVIKLDGKDFKAVGQVTHSRREFEGEEFAQHVCGIKFLTVNFDRLKGHFFSAKA